MDLSSGKTNNEIRKNIGATLLWRECCFPMVVIKGFDWRLAGSKYFLCFLVRWRSGVFHCSDPEQAPRSWGGDVCLSDAGGGDEPARVGGMVAPIEVVNKPMVVATSRECDAGVSE